MASPSRMHGAASWLKLWKPRGEGSGRNPMTVPTSSPETRSSVLPCCSRIFTGEKSKNRVSEILLDGAPTHSFLVSRTRKREARAGCVLTPPSPSQRARPLVPTPRVRKRRLTVAVTSGTALWQNRTRRWPSGPRSVTGVLLPPHSPVRATPFPELWEPPAASVSADRGSTGLEESSTHRFLASGVVLTQLVGGVLCSVLLPRPHSL